MCASNCKNTNAFQGVCFKTPSSRFAINSFAVTVTGTALAVSVLFCLLSVIMPVVNTLALFALLINVLLTVNSSMPKQTEKSEL